MTQMPDDQDDRINSPRRDIVFRVSVVITAIMAALVIWLVLSGCTVIAFNKGEVTTSESDSHDADGTNKASTFDVNLSPR